MNYFAHGHSCIDRPWVLVGTALPDWLAAADRKSRLRRHLIAPGDDPAGGELAAGIVRHLDDDRWFHETPAFLQTSAEIAGLFGDACPHHPQLRAWFWGHVVTELLLDRLLIARDPARLDAYYTAIASVDADRVLALVTPWLTRPPEGLHRYRQAFLQHRFLAGYSDDAGLFARLAGLARRVGLAPLPQQARAALPQAHKLVETRMTALLTNPEPHRRAV